MAYTYQPIYITYDHSGKKLRKQVVNTSAATVYTQDYVDGLEYRTNGGGSLTLEAIYHPEGRITPNGANYQYEYTIKDHLGNARVSFADLNANNLVDVPGDILQENHYYPFGMNMNYGWMNNVGLIDDRHQYNGKELNDDFGLNLSDYGARWYDASVGRWWSVDPLGEELEQIDESPYVAFWNNPIVYDDPEGQCPNCATAGIGAVVGGLIGGGIELGRQLWDDGKVTSWSAVGGSALQGAITGGAAGFTGGASLLATAAVTGTANAVGGAVNRSIQGQSTTVKNVVTDATVGAVLGAGGKIVGNVVENATNKLSNAAKGKLGETVTEVKYAAKGYVKKGNALVDTGRKTSTGRDQIAKYDHKMENVITGKQLTVESKFNKSKLSPNQVAAQSRVTTLGGLIIDRTTSQGLGNTTKAATTGTGAGIDAQRNKKQ